MEEVRQWILRELITTYAFPKEWVGSRIVRGSQVPNPDDTGVAPCLLVRLAEGNPFLAVVVSTPGEIRNGEVRLRDLMIASSTIGLGMSTDGTEAGTRFLRHVFSSGKCEYVNDFDPFAPTGIAPGTQPLLGGRPANGATDRAMVPLTERIENLFFEVHSAIRDTDGLHPDEALDELCKIIYAKLYDEETAKTGTPFRLQRWVYGTTEELAASVRSLYRDANDYDLRVFRLKIPGYERSRGVFSSPIRLSSPCIARIIGLLDPYTLTASDADVKGRAFQKVLGPTFRAGLGQYFTPEPAVRFMVRVMSPETKDLILDPFCGSAHFLSQSLDHVRRHLDSAASKAYHEFAFGKLHGIEKSDRMVRVAMTDMRLHGDGHSNIRCTDALLDFSNYSDLEAESFDLVLTNPPFGSLLGGESISQLGVFELAAGKRSVPLEVLGLERSLQFVRPGGRVGIVLPDGILTNRKTKYVRDWLQSKARVRAIVSLPIETFSPFGANIKTSILFLRKWERGETKTAKYPVTLVRIDAVGYDASGRKREEDDLPVAADRLCEELRTKGW
ncbi:MAG: SAM-dependent DNA methyltransferase [Deltaproteobacteria bacterium]|nr:SAM-dependent DNA methyltransferase [Deltaproteobacteria bacterium]